MACTWRTDGASVSFHGWDVVRQGEEVICGPIRRLVRRLQSDEQEDAVMRYHLTARAFVGPLSAPVRNETRSQQSDSRDELESQVPSLVKSGFDVWLYEHQGFNTYGSETLVVIARYERGSGTRVR